MLLVLLDDGCPRRTNAWVGSMHGSFVPQGIPTDCKRLPSATNTANFWISDIHYETPDICQKAVSSPYGMVPDEHALPQLFLVLLGNFKLTELN